MRPNAELLRRYLKQRMNSKPKPKAHDEAIFNLEIAVAVRLLLLQKAPDLLPMLRVGGVERRLLQQSPVQSRFITTGST